MIEIRVLESSLTLEECRYVMDGYVTHEKFVVCYSDTPVETHFSLELVRLDQPITHHYDHMDVETLRMYNEVLPHGFSFGAYAGGRLVGFVIAEKRDWNNSLWVWEFHVASNFRGQGLGRALMDHAAAAARAANLRTIVCETQNHNAPAIHAYRKLGFRVEGIDISYYTNEDYPDNRLGIAVFMKRRL